jgi:hypothetical protein
VAPGDTVTLTISSGQVEEEHDEEDDEESGEGDDAPGNSEQAPGHAKDDKDKDKK